MGFHGGGFHTLLALTVSGSTPPPPPPPQPTPPAGAVTKSNIEQMPGWESCTVCAGANAKGPVAIYSMVENQASPWLDGNSAKFSISGTTPYSDALWWKQLGAFDSATNLQYDVDFYITNPGVIQALEFDNNQSNGAHKFIFGSECNIKGNHWDVWERFRQLALNRYSLRPSNSVSVAPCDVAVHPNGHQCCLRGADV